MEGCRCAAPSWQIVVAAIPCGPRSFVPTALGACLGSPLRMGADRSFETLFSVLCELLQCWYVVVVRRGDVLFQSGRPTQMRSFCRTLSLSILSSFTPNSSRSSLMKGAGSGVIFFYRKGGVIDFQIGFFGEKDPHPLG